MTEIKVRPGIERDEDFWECLVQFLDDIKDLNEPGQILMSFREIQSDARYLREEIDRDWER